MYRNLLKTILISSPLICSGSVTMVAHNNHTIANPTNNSLHTNHTNSEYNSALSSTISYKTYLHQIQTLNANLGVNDAPYNALGTGYDVTNGIDSIHSIFKSDDLSKVSIRTKSTALTFNSINDTSSLIKNLGVNTSLKFGFKKLGGSAAVNFFNSTQTDSKTISAIFSYSTTVDEVFLEDDASISPIAQNIINYCQSQNQKDPKAWSSFIKRYSDRLIFHETATRQVLFNLQIKCSDQNTRTSIKTKLSAHYGLNDLKLAVNELHQSHKGHNSINLQYQTFPGEAENILPVDGINIDSFSGDIGKILSNSETFINDYHKDPTTGSADNVAQWFPKGLNNATDLDKYIDFMPWVNAVNPYLYLMKKFPELDKYFDEAIALNKDVLSDNTHPRPTPSPSNNNKFVDDYTRIANIDSRYNDLFTTGDAIDNLLLKHTDTLMLQSINTIRQSFQGYDDLNIVDWFNHTSFTMKNGSDNHNFYIEGINTINGHGNELNLALIDSNQSADNFVNIVMVKEDFTFNNTNLSLWVIKDVYAQYSNGEFNHFIINNNDNLHYSHTGYYYDLSKDQSKNNDFGYTTALKNLMTFDPLYDGEDSHGI